jgi:5-hydroxyisourate hydrolase
MGISTHILDTALGRPAANVAVSLARFTGHPGDQQWISLSAPNLRTDADGRVRELLPLTTPLSPGLYRIRFETAGYYHAQHLTGLYPWVEIAFEVHKWENDTIPHYHIPLLLTANGYTTYRGS